MNVRLLGTGSADGWPNPFCSCASCTAERVAGRVRGQTSALVDGVLLLDCGPSTPLLAASAGVSLAGVRFVLLTHDHSDHCSPAFLLYRSWVAGDAPLEVVGPPSVIDAARQWVHPSGPVRFTAVSPGDRLTLGSYDVTVLEAAHDGDAVLYKVDGLLYATDTGPLPASTVASLRGASLDVVLLEETFGDHTTHGTDHLDLASFGEQLRVLREVGAVTAATDVVAVHLSHHNPPTPELARRLADWGARVVDDGTSLVEPVSALVEPVSALVEPVETTPLRSLVLGGARSGKSREAERMLAAEPSVTYVATAYPAELDDEWAERVRLHRDRRPSHWETLETLDLVALLDKPGPPLLVDCLTLWLTRVMDAHDAWSDDAWAAGAEQAVDAEVEALAAAWRTTERRVVAVSNEVGQGVVPESAAGRRFRDQMGRLNARIASVTEDVRWCTAGRVSTL